MSDMIVVVNTCDAYEDVWELFFRAFREYWPECKYEIVLNTESVQRSFRDHNLRIHNWVSATGRDLWGMRLRQALGACDSEYVLMLYDDYVLDGPVDHQEIEKCIQWLMGNPWIAVFYLINIPGNKDDVETDFAGFELLPQRGDFKLNSAPAVWRRETLMNFVGDHDDPWTWEYFGSHRTYGSAFQFYCAQAKNQGIFPYSHETGGAIYRGKWVEKVVLPKMMKYGLKIDTAKRGVSDWPPAKGKRTLLWKLRFFLRGFRMIGFGAFVFAYRLIRKRLWVRPT